MAPVKSHFSKFLDKVNNKLADQKNVKYSIQRTVNTKVSFK